jgi:hypothetical protein
MFAAIGGQPWGRSLELETKPVRDDECTKPCRLPVTLPTVALAWRLRALHVRRTDFLPSVTYGRPRDAAAHRVCI